MKRGLITVTPHGPTEEVQRKALQEAGVHERAIYVDHLPKRHRKGKTVTVDYPMRQEAIRSLRNGDVLAVYDLSRLGKTTDEILGVLEEIAARESEVLEVTSGESYRFHPEAIAVAAVASRAAQSRLREATAAARKVAVQFGKLGGRPPVLQGDTRAEASQLWANLDLSAREVAERVGVSVRALYNAFGARSDHTGNANTTASTPNLSEEWRSLDRAEEIARALVDQFRPLFRPDAEHLAVGLVNAIAGELRGEAGRVRTEATAATEQALAAIRRIQ